MSFQPNGLSPNPSIYSFNITLYRDDTSIPWGFKLEGGKDHESPLIIQRVFQGSPAGHDLQRGDIILAIDNYETSFVYQQEANSLLVNASTALNLTIKRGIPYPCSDGDAFYKRRHYQQYLSQDLPSPQQLPVPPHVQAPATPAPQPQKQYYQAQYSVNQEINNQQKNFVDIPYPGYSLDPPAKRMFTPSSSQQQQQQEINPKFKPTQIDPALLNPLSPGFNANPNAIYRSKQIEKYTIPKPILSQTGSHYLPFTSIENSSATSKVKVYKPSKTTPLFGNQSNQQQQPAQQQQDPFDENELISKLATTVIQRAQGGPVPSFGQEPHAIMGQQQLLNVNTQQNTASSQWQSINQQPQFSPSQNNLSVKQQVSPKPQLVTPSSQQMQPIEQPKEDLKIVNKQYNTPIGLYAKDTITDEIKKRSVVVSATHGDGLSEF